MKELNDEGSVDGKDVVDVRLFMMHIAKNTVHMANWAGRFVYEGVLRTTPVLLEGYSGPGEKSDSDLELDATVSDASQRSIPLVGSKVIGPDKKKKVSENGTQKSTAVPATAPTPGVPEADVNRGGHGPRFHSMTETVAYCSGDRGFIKHDEGGSYFFFWTNGNDIKWGDKVNFQFDPSAEVRETYHRRKAFAVCVVGASGRQGAAAFNGDLRVKLTQQRNTRAAWGNNDIRACAKEDVVMLIRRVQAMLDKSAKDNADVKKAMEAMAHQANRVGSS